MGAVIATTPDEVPAAHGAHADDPAAAAHPGGQLEQAVDKTPDALPAGHCEQDDALADDTDPAAQGAQAVVGLDEKLPALQGVQTTAPPMVVVATVPGWHAMHAELDDEPGGLVAPAPHVTHADCPGLAYAPAGHCVHDVAGFDSVPELTVPGRHGRHADDDEAFAFELYVPAPHAMQPVAAEGRFA